SLWMVVPRKVAFDYIVPQYHEAMKTQIRQGRTVNPLHYASDCALWRRLRLLKNHLSHFMKYKKYYEKKH
ncbi:MAG: carbamoylphosphate synthase large subunit, partial [Firmicutes bacterium]|nr:carbamoylphosphate synthase large subunit [Bacillota bacterium]